MTRETAATASGSQPLGPPPHAGVARRLFMSEGTVRNHISSILAKLGLRNRTQVAVAYYRSARAG